MQPAPISMNYLKSHAFPEQHLAYFHYRGQPKRNRNPGLAHLFAGGHDELTWIHTQVIGGSLTRSLPGLQAFFPTWQHKRTSRYSYLSQGKYRNAFSIASSISLDLDKCRCLHCNFMNFALHMPKNNSGLNTIHCLNRLWKTTKGGGRNTPMVRNTSTEIQNACSGEEIYFSES